MPTIAGSVTQEPATYQAQEGRFRRIGDLCVAEFFLYSNTLFGTTGGAIMGGLPFPVATNGSGILAFVSNTTLAVGCTQFGINSSSGGSCITLSKMGSGKNDQELQVAKLTGCLPNKCSFCGILTHFA